MRSNAIKVATLGAMALIASSVAAPSGAAGTQVVALIASSAQAPFEEIAKEFQTKHNDVTIKTSFLGGQQIGDQVDSQAPADVVLVGSGTTDKEANLLAPPQAVYRNREAILVPKGNPGNIKTLKDLGNPGVKISIGTPASAVGKLASQVVQNGAADFGFEFVKNVRNNIAVQADKGSDVVAAVVSGKANAAIGFESDKDDSKYTTIPIEDKYNVISTYNMAVTKNAKNASAASDLMKLATGPEGQAIFHKFNYLSPK
jgi:molybdate transport system substrate-binding protein